VNAPESSLASRLRAALHALETPPAGKAWNFEQLVDVLPDRGARLCPAAVLIGLIEGPGGFDVLLTRRTDGMRHHAGQVAFPGGRIEAADADPVAAALRESEEEVGLPRSRVRPWGYLDPFATITGFHVYPVVAVVQAGVEFRPDAGEVAEAFQVPLDFLLDPGNVITSDVEWQGRSRQIVEFRWRDYRIWGATAAMLVNLQQRMGR
jgi:8-oxo-dGTP pyrophosphatase MutT (NUDIX family)